MIMNLVTGWAQTVSIYGIISVIVFLVLSNFLPITYRLPGQILGILALVMFVYLKGGESERSKWELKVEQQKTEIALLESKSKDLSAAATDLYQQKKTLLTVNGKLKNVRTYITIEEVNACVIPDSFVRLHNDSAKGVVSNAARVANGASK